MSSAYKTPGSVMSNHGIFSKAGQTTGFGGLGNSLLQMLNARVQLAGAGGGPNDLTNSLIQQLLALLGAKDAAAMQADKFGTGGAGGQMAGGMGGGASPSPGAGMPQRSRGGGRGGY